MFPLKPITPAGIPKALEKAQHYRLLNEPRQAESICRDILAIDQRDHRALTTMLLALTDQFGRGSHVLLEHAQEVLPRLEDDYERAYYAGIVFERWAKAQMDLGVPGHVAFDLLRCAMDHYEAAEKLSPEGNDDAILRWNTCVRILHRHPEIRPRSEDAVQVVDIGDSAPLPP